jgi:hypothetical protein
MSGFGLWVQQEAETVNWFYGPVATSVPLPSSPEDPPFGATVSRAGSYMTQGEGVVVVQSMLLITGVGGGYILGREDNRPWTSRHKTAWTDVSSSAPRDVSGYLPLTLGIEVRFVGWPTSEITFHGHRVYVQTPD